MQTNDQSAIKKKQWNIEHIHFAIKHLKKNQIVALNNPYGIEIQFKK